MKPILKTKIIFTLLIFSTFVINSQVTVKAESMTYSNGTLISECGTIDLGINQNITISFWAKLTKNSNQVVGDGYLYVYTKNDVNSATENNLFSEQVLSSAWLSNNTQYDKYIPVTLESQTFNLTGGVLFVRYVSSSNVEYESCNYSVIKDETPTFTISPNTTSIVCGSTDSKTFTVENEYNSPGTLSYEWTIGSGWLLNNGNPAPSTLTTSGTSGNTLTLIPNANPPGNVSVVPILNNISYDMLTSTVSLAPYNPTNTIVGGATACSSGQTYSISNLPSNVNVTSWSISNSSIASISNSSGNQTSLTVNGYGLVTLTAVLTNSCGQVSPPITKDIYIGRPQPATKIFGPKTVNYGVLANYSVNTIAGATSYEWRLPYPYTTVFNINYWSNNWQLLQATSTTNAITSFTGYGGNSGYVQVWGKNTCGNGGAKYILVNFSTTGGGQQPKNTIKKNNIDFGVNNGVFSIFPNPVRDEIHLHVLNQKNDSYYKIQIFDLKSVLVKEISLNNAIEIIDVRTLVKGMYILKYISKDKVRSQKIIIER
jgi:Secretion system C-terminal sorting domain/PKD-like domain